MTTNEKKPAVVSSSTQSSSPKKLVIQLPGIRTDKKVPQRKLDYGKKLRLLLEEYTTCLIVSVDNVGSKQIADMRKDFRGRARFLFGKNTLIRKVIRDYMKATKNRLLLNLMEVVRGNCGFVFTKESVALLRKEILERKKQCAAKTGVFAPVDVFIPPGATGMEPTQTQMFQAMNIATRINRGQIDICDEVHLIKKGDKVGASQAALLVKLGIRPFYYGMKVNKIYENGKVYDASVLDITTDDIARSFYNGLRTVAAFCFTINYPTILTIPHTVINAYKKTLSIGLELNQYSWDGLDLIKKILENPEAFAAAAGGGSGGSGGDKKEEKKEAEKEATPEKESSVAPANPFGGGDEDSSEEEDD